MDKSLKRIIGEALDSMPVSKVTDFVIKNHRPMFDIWAHAAFGVEVNRAVRRRQRAELRENPAQAWLDLPDLKDFQHIPVAVRKDSLEEFRERIVTKQREIDSYKRARLSMEKERIARRELREMKRLEPLIAPFFAQVPTMTVGRAIELYRKNLSTPATEQRRAAARSREASKKGRWHRTKNQ